MMTDSLSPDVPRRLLTDLCRLVADRSGGEQELAAGAEARNLSLEKEYADARRLLDERYQAEKQSAESQYASLRDETLARFKSEYSTLKKEYETVRSEILARATADQQAAEQALQDAHWEAMEASDLARGGVNMPLAEILAGLDSRWQELERIHHDAVALLQARGHWDQFPESPSAGLILEKQPGRRFCHALEQAQVHYRNLAKQFLPQLFQGFRPWAILLGLWLVIAYPAIAIFGLSDWRWAAVSAAATAVVGTIAGVWTYQIARRQSVESYLALRRVLLEAGLGNPAVLEAAKADCRRLDATVISRHKLLTKKADETYATATAEIARRRDEDLRRADEAYPKRLAELEAWRDRTIREAEAKYPPLLERLDEQYRAECERLRQRHDQTAAENQRRRQQETAELAQCWLSGMERFHAAAENVEQFARESFPDWNSNDWQHWQPPAAIPPLVSFGRCRVSLAEMAGGLPDDPAWRPKRLEYELPVTLPFPRHSLLLLKAAGTARSQAVEIMQTAMLRLLTAMPPGKVRFTIIDPVGLGDNFSAFMHLADYDEQLVASRIWTDAGHIEQRLADLTKHMENVIQVYLRKEFHSIEEYNEFAGELAEPYRVLVAANFPANFSEAAAHRIKSIVASGARCGVFAMLSVDTNLPLPRNFVLPDLEADATVLRWDQGRFVWEHPDYGPLAIDCPPPPPVDRFKEILRVVGSAAKDTGRVEVPFSCIVPPETEWWTADSRGGISVPLGRAGAMKLQHLDLGAGTSQHALVSGKTGSGKSTLLHVLVTNLSLRYSPDEVELYLVDFKKGVEFKAYARAQLPHARVVAIESEREFGLSVLERLDAELRERGDLFRRRGVQDLKSYRTLEPTARLPRVLLIVDEFQELFVEDDRIAQDAALLLDRLVRQGRAFGIHVLLGSQTLGGAYTLARSTIGQMAVRIALQCSEADAHLILSEDNTAARLLTRPGEAIYNDANGLYEGNHPFQVVWLTDNDRDDYLRRIGELARQRGCNLPPPIVFEGNVLADLADNAKLRELLEAKKWPAPTQATPAWLGSAVAIKDPTAAVFLRQNGSNLLLVGHREEAALGVMGGCFISLAAQILPDLTGKQETPTFFILDGMRSDAPEVGFWNRMAELVPHAVKLANVRGSGELLNQLAAELSTRQAENRENAPPIYLFLYNLGRFRDLKRDEDYGYSSDEGKPANPARQFAAILRDGPALGIHCVVWCDTYSNVSRMIDRQSLRDFELRVLFQMNANDSSSLMDTPEASRLGVHRAIYYDEGQGRMEKFRPYGLPAAEWLAFVHRQLDRRRSV